MLKYYFLSLNFILTIYIIIVNVLNWKNNNELTIETKKKINRIHFLIFGNLFIVYLVILIISPLFISKFIFEYIIIGAILHIFYAVYSYRILILGFV